MSAPQTSETAVSTPERLACDVHGCDRSAVEVLRFRGQPGHVHVCGPCGAIDREHCDVICSGPLPCPWPETHGTSWVAKPRELS